MPLANVIYLQGANMPVERLIWGLTNGQINLKSMTVIGRDADGKLQLMSTHAKGKDILWDMEQIKRDVVDME